MKGNRRLYPEELYCDGLGYGVKRRGEKWSEEDGGEEEKRKRKRTMKDVEAANLYYGVCAQLSEATSLVGTGCCAQPD